jgi:hypothetical protein
LEKRLTTQRYLSAIATSAESVTIRTWTVTCSATDLFQKAISIIRKLTCLDYGRGKGGFLYAYRKPFWQGLSELKYENSTAGFRARFQFLACQAETRDHLIMPAQAYTVNSGLTILGKGLDAGATFNGDVAKGIGQLKAGQLMKYVVNDARQERHLDKDDGSAPLCSRTEITFFT